jgi:hypothetical protein
VGMGYSLRAMDARWLQGVALHSPQSSAPLRSRIGPMGLALGAHG